MGEPQPLSGKVTSQFTNNETGEIAFEIELEIESPGSGTARANSILIKARGMESVTRDMLTEIAKGLDRFVDQGAAYLHRKALEASLPKLEPGQTITITQEGTGQSFTFVVGEDGVARSTTTNEALRDMRFEVSDNFTEETFAELQRRRGMQLTGEDFERVAHVYREARSEKRSAQKAVADEFFVSVARAKQLIAEARSRGLLPATTRGKAT